VRLTGEDVAFGALVGVAAGAAEAAALCAVEWPVLAGAPGLAVAVAGSALSGALVGAVANRRARRSRDRGHDEGPHRGARSAAAFGVLVAVAACLLLRRIGWSDLELFLFRAGFGPWGQIAVVSLPAAGLTAGVATALDARAG
jgi:hypothetical protein